MRDTFALFTGEGRWWSWKGKRDTQLKGHRPRRQLKQMYICGLSSARESRPVADSIGEDECQQEALDSQDVHISMFDVAK